MALAAVYTMSTGSAIPYIVKLIIVGKEKTFNVIVNTVLQ